MKAGNTVDDLALKRVLHAELDAAAVRSRGDPPDGAGVQSRHRVGEIRAIKQVEELGPKMEAVAFRDEEVLHQTRVKIGVARTDDYAAPGVAEGQRRVLLKCPRIEVLRDELRARPVGWEAGITNRVCTIVIDQRKRIISSVHHGEWSAAGQTHKTRQLPPTQSVAHWRKPALAQPGDLPYPGAGKNVSPVDARRP